MRLFTDQQYRGLLVLVPMALILLLLAVLIEILREPQLLPEVVEHEQALDALPLSEFDPNVATYEELRHSGVDREVAVGIVRWRKWGKVYRIKEDLALVTGMTDSLYQVLEPYIVIADSLVPKPRAKEFAERKSDTSATPSAIRNNPRKKSLPQERFLIDTASVEYLSRWGLSRRQAEVVVRYRDARGGIFSEEELRECYVISEQVADAMMPFVCFRAKPNAEVESNAETKSREEVQPKKDARKPLVEINSADSAQLVAVRGIGAKSAAEILKYRKLLGGYYSVEQISELKCVTEHNFEQILQQIYCDSCKIQKIDINFAPPKEVARHPYMSAAALRKIIKQRQLKGGWSRIEEMVEDKILSEDEAKRLAPYLWFRLDATR